MGYRYYWGYYIMCLFCVSELQNYFGATIFVNLEGNEKTISKDLPLLRVPGGLCCGATWFFRGASLGS